MAANLKYQIEGEQNRVTILDYLKGKELSAMDIGFGVGMSKQKVENYLRSLLRSGHIVNFKTVKNRFYYKRTNKPFYTMAMRDQQIDDLYDESQDEVIVAPNPHARVIRLLSKPLAPPPPSKRRSTGYGSMQSAMSMFSLEG